MDQTLLTPEPPDYGSQPRTYHHHPRWGEHSQQIRKIRRPPTTTAPCSPGPSQLRWWRQQELLCCCEKHTRSIVIRLGRRHPALQRREKGSLTITRLLLFWGHVGGRVRSIGRTFWPSRDEPKIMNILQPQCAAASRDSFSSWDTHLHTHT